jgi:hypothetical protein
MVVWCFVGNNSSRADLVVNTGLGMTMPIVGAQPLKPAAFYGIISIQTGIHMLSKKSVAGPLHIQPTKD